MLRNLFLFGASGFTIAGRHRELVRTNLLPTGEKPLSLFFLRELSTRSIRTLPTISKFGPGSDLGIGISISMTVSTEGQIAEECVWLCRSRSKMGLKPSRKALGGLTY